MPSPRDRWVRYTAVGDVYESYCVSPKHLPVGVTSVTVSRTRANRAWTPWTWAVWTKTSRTDGHRVSSRATARRRALAVAERLAR